MYHSEDGQHLTDTFDAMVARLLRSSGSTNMTTE